MGFHCSLFDDKAKRCTGKWVPCTGSRAGGRCSYNEFLRHMGKLPNEKNWAVFQSGSTTRLDTDATAKRCLQIYQTKGNGKPVRNFAPYQVMKGESDKFNRYIVRMGNIVDDAARTHKIGANSYLWDDYDTTRDRTVAVRAGDHGEKLVAAAKTALGGKMDIKTLNLGPHPTDPSKTLETMDWKGTAMAAKNKGVPNYKDELKSFYNSFYDSKLPGGRRTPDAKLASDHRAVIRSYKKTVDAARACR